MRLRNPSD
jgi:hypothetical protein